MKTPMTNIASPAKRQAAYLIYTVLAIIGGALQVGYSSASWPQPVWLTVSIAVLSFLGGALGFTAASNVKPDVPAQELPRSQPEVNQVQGDVQPIS
jgi:peptidoglycan/LPS O-acetylase OafA/YrhL